MRVKEPIPESFALFSVSLITTDRHIASTEIACLCVKGDINSTLVSIFLEKRRGRKSGIIFW